MTEYEKMSISDYLKIPHHDERQFFTVKLLQRQRDGENISEEEWHNVIHQPVRVGDEIPEIGKEFPIMITEKKIVEEGKMPGVIMQLKRVMLIE